jgi:glutathione S-transferase
VLETEEGEFLPESNAILYYLAEGTPFLSEDRLGRAMTLRWMFFEQYSHEPNVAVARAWLHVFDVRMTEERRTALEAKQKLGYDALSVMEKHLEGNDFFVGDRYSVADIALYAYTHVADEGGFDLEGFPVIRAWLERVSSQPKHIPITRG